MKIAIVHYHLEPGGVTRVIENTVDSFKEYDETVEFVILSGREYSGTKLKNNRVVEGLDYSPANKAISHYKLKERMENAAIKGLKGKPDLWHIHNHSLGKNPSLTLACSLLAEESYPILLHPHDFAEDGRPSNFHELRDVYSKAYPTSSKIHYAVLNHRDLSFVKKLLNDKSERTHLLANAISPPTAKKQRKPTNHNLPDNFFLYPVRAVRRKNLGELSLIATIHKDKFFANSLGPTNPDYQSKFLRWKEFSAQLKLPVSFGFGEHTPCSFQEMMESSNGILSTSIAEGFGLGFLEPWTFEKYLHGRNIPEITNDFSSLGIQLDHMYNRIEIDINHLSDKSKLKPKIISVLQKLFSDYQVELPEDSLDIAYNSIVKEGNLDFGRMDEIFQEEIILSINQSKNSIKDIYSQIKLDPYDNTLIQKNYQAVLQNFSTRSYVKKLKNIYLRLLDSESQTVEYADGRKLLKSFLTPERVNLLRT